MCDTRPRNCRGTGDQPRAMGQLTRVLIGDTSESIDIIDIAESRRGVGSMYKCLNGRLLQDSVCRVDVCVSSPLKQNDIL